MRPSRFPSLLWVPLLTLALAACGGGSPGASTGDNGNGGHSDAASVAESADTGGPGASSGTGHSAEDLQQLADDLTPPNSSQTAQTTGEGVIYTIYTSTDDPASLQSHYDSAIEQAGLNVYSTTTSGDTYAWVFAASENSTFGGSVVVGPASDGGSGSSVVVTVGNG